MLVKGPRRYLRKGERWYAVQTLPRREAGAQRQLENQGFCTFLPRLKVTRRQGRKLETVLAPFFPRYLFIVLDMERDRWRSVNGTYGVAQLVMQGDRPLPIPKGVIEALIESAEGFGLLGFEKDGRLHVGNRAEVLVGPFCEQVGLIEHLDEKGRVSLLLDLMGRAVRTTVLKEDVRPFL